MTDTARRRVAVATDGFGQAHDEELPVLVAALRDHGYDAEAVAWDDPAYAWPGVDAVLIRSTWEYTERLSEFRAWLDVAAATTVLHNPAAVVRWNTDKTYLAQLEAHGVPIVPTGYLAPGEPVVLPADGEIVVKPSVSVGGRNSARYTVAQRAAAEEHVRFLHAEGATAMVQPYLPRIVDGERALVFLGGRFSHAMRKGPVLTDTGRIDNQRDAHPNPVPHTPGDAELALADAALSALKAIVPGADEPLLYARVDVALADDGAPVVMELELIEPNLFLTRVEGGVARYVAAVEAAIGAP
ncbi:ATP-grasp domain-containing protein [Yinghuangia seranimata]|uniref:ATP-grasp domain-containing protein n=1 Tax=Yinghuangia seranimata TaxID=408067 RepID=UPI00248C3975|nr:hypothetical protein [Yinghuangia seranimata]MDI2125594.1 hypothetical protein [Yinghuangia seranimata]